MNTNHDALREAALNWWKQRRPIDWPPEKHLVHPTVNCTSPAEDALAVVCAALSQPMPEAAAQGWKDGDTAKLVNDLRDVAVQFHDAQQLRERIAHVIRPLTYRLSASPAAPEGAKPAAEFQCPPGMALVPIRLTREMEQYLMEDDWDWPELLGVAGTVTEEQLAQAEDAQPQPPHPQPQAQGEPDEREAFEAWYCADAAKQGIDLPEGIKRLRDGGSYGEQRHMLNGKWEGWQARAQSHREAIAEHRAALVACVTQLEAWQSVLIVGGRPDPEVAAAITQANGVLGRKEGGI